MGKPKPKPEIRSEHNNLMGSLVQRVLEDYSNNSMWEHPLGLDSRLKTLSKDYLDTLKENYSLTHESPSLNEILKEALPGVMTFPKTARAHGWLVPGLKSEVKIVDSLRGISVGARIDFIVPDGDSAILLDGKNTKYRMKYTDPDQLRFYQLIYELSTGKTPTKLGLVWFRFPYDEASGETGVDWVPCTQRDIQGLADRIKKTYISMVRGEFSPTPVPSKCKWCDYEPVCQERQAQRKANAVKRNIKPKKEVHLPQLGKGWFTPGEE